MKLRIFVNPLLSVVHVVGAEPDLAVVAVEGVVNDVEPRVTKRGDLHKTLHLDTPVDSHYQWDPFLT